MWATTVEKPMKVDPCIRVYLHLLLMIGKKSYLSLPSKWEEVAARVTGALIALKIKFLVAG